MFLKKRLTDGLILLKLPHRAGDALVQKIQRLKTFVQSLLRLGHFVVGQAQAEDLQEHRRADQQRDQRNKQEAGEKLPPEGMWLFHGVSSCGRKDCQLFRMFPRSRLAQAAS